MKAQEWQEKQEEMRREVVAHLLERVAKDTYPSTTMLDLIEQSMGPEDVEQYVDVLMEKVTQDQYPSYALIDRLRQQVGLHPASRQ
ncbi:MAG: hypothetical protein Q8Q02_05220 [Nocardioides sp.]|nr:hypothetical protein [Nocardioides sp.]